MSLSVSDVLQALHGTSYPRAALELADAQRDAFAKPLLDILSETVETGVIPGGHQSHILATVLLTRAQDTRAHPHIAALARASEAEDLLGDYATEFLPASLWHTSGGSPDALLDIARHLEATLHNRAAAARALTFGVAYNVLERDTVLKALAGLLTPDDNPDFKLLVISNMLDLHPLEYLPLIEATFEIDDIDGVYLTPDYIQELLSQGPEALHARLMTSVEARGTVPLHTLESWPMWEDPTELKRTVGGRVSLARRPAKRRRKKRQ